MTDHFALTDVVKSWDPVHRERCKTCPQCGQDCNTVGITKLVYTFEVCDCGTVDYDHLIEQLWHGMCLVGSQTKADQWESEVLAKAWLVFTYPARQKWNGYRTSQWEKAHRFAAAAIQATRGKTAA